MGVDDTLRVELHEVGLEDDALAGDVRAQQSDAVGDHVLEALVVGIGS